MITNERQYRITKGWLERFTQAQAGVTAESNTLHPRLAQALHDQYAVGTSPSSNLSPSGSYPRP